MRARGANAVSHLAFETAGYGVSPATNYFKIPFADTNLGEAQGLIESDLLGGGRHPQQPSDGEVNDDGEYTVPVDLRNFGQWLKLLCGAPVTTQGVAASGTFTFSAQPAANSILTIAGTAFTFVSGTPTGNQIKIGASLAETLQNAVATLNASAVVAIAAATYSMNRDGTVLTVTYDTVGTGGNAVTIVAGTSPATNATASGATLAGGSASGPYNHVFTMGAVSLPSASIEIGNPDVPSFVMNYGVMLDALSIKLQRSGHLSAKVNLIAQGEKDPTTTTGAGTPTELDVERFSQFSGELIIDGGVPLADIITADVRLSNGLDKVEGLRGDGRIDGVDPGMMAVTGETVSRFKDLTLFNRAKAGAPFEKVLRWAISSTKRLEIKTHRVYFPRKVKRPITGPAGVQQSFPWQAAEHPTLGTCTITLVNDVASYA